MTDIKVFEGISAVTFGEISVKDTASDISALFTGIGNAGIDLDMISLELCANDKMNVGFTFADDDLSKLLGVVKQAKVPAPLVNCGNVKFVIKSAEMIGIPGYSAKVFAACCGVGCVPILVTTGIDEISVLVRDSESADVGTKLHEIFK